MQTLGLDYQYIYINLNFFMFYIKTSFDYLDYLRPLIIYNIIDTIFLVELLVVFVIQ